MRMIAAAAALATALVAVDALARTPSRTCQNVAHGSILDTACFLLQRFPRTGAMPLEIRRASSDQCSFTLGGLQTLHLKNASGELRIADEGKLHTCWTLKGDRIIEDPQGRVLGALEVCGPRVPHDLIESGFKTLFAHCGVATAAAAPAAPPPAAPCVAARTGTFTSAACWLVETMTATSGVKFHVVEADERACTFKVDRSYFGKRVDDAQIVHVKRADGNMHIEDRRQRGSSGGSWQTCWTLTGPRLTEDAAPNRFTGQIDAFDEATVCGRPIAHARVRRALESLLVKNCGVRPSEF